MVVQADFLGLILAIGLIFAIVALVYGFVVVMIAYPLLRYIVGGGLILLIWVNNLDPVLSWILTVVIGIGMINPLFLFVGIVGFIIGYLTMRK